MLYFGIVNIQLNEAIAAALSAQAAAQGLTVSAYLENLFLAEPKRLGTRLTVDELDRLLDEEATISPSPAGTFSRTDLYSDHD